MRDFTKKYFHLNSSAVYNSSAKNNPPVSLLCHNEVASTIPDFKRDVCYFIVENGDQYPSGSLYDLLQGLSLYFEYEKGFEHKLMSGAFCDIWNTLENMMKE